MPASRDSLTRMERNATPSGDTCLKVLSNVWSPQLECHRDIFVHLPASYARGNRRYPVLYVQDGQDLFAGHPGLEAEEEPRGGVRGSRRHGGPPPSERPAEIYAGDWRRRGWRDAGLKTPGSTGHDPARFPAGAEGAWRAHDTLIELEAEGIEAIVVGIPHMGSRRMDEYGPFRDPQHGGGEGEDYVAFVAGTLKSIIDCEFRTLRHRRATGILGASMGAHISLYAFFSRPEVFGMVGAMSPSIWFADGALLPMIGQARWNQGRIYLDVGTEEGGSRGAKGVPVEDQPGPRGEARRLYRLLCDKGYRPGDDLKFFEERGGRHEAEAWGRRLPDALRFLLSE